MRRRGFTLMEVMLAIVILVVVATTTARFASEFSRAMAKSSVRVIASGVAADRLELIRADPRYPRLVSIYGSGAGADTTAFPGYAQMRRITNIVRDQSGTPARDRTTVTVRIIEPTLKDTVAVTTVIASP
ncbi:MAG: prepilin-type N-terminal cleavage/methylation domain-containing protein [Gemmatimonadota bacterium]